MKIPVHSDRRRRIAVDELRPKEEGYVYLCITESIYGYTYRFPVEMITEAPDLVIERLDRSLDAYIASRK